jgi:predicted phosphodiesterase
LDHIRNHGLVIGVHPRFHWLVCFSGRLGVVWWFVFLWEFPVRLALIGDIHHYRLDVALRQLMSKRLLGHTNLWLNRRFRFNHALLTPLFARIAGIKPDHVLLTGDVTTTALENEFLDVVKFLKPLSDQFPTLVVPGNHDKYTFRSARTRRGHVTMGGLMPPSFPHLLRLSERWSLLALDAARPRVMLSRGQLGRAQLDTVKEQVATLQPGQGLVVLCHYPLGGPPNAPPQTFDHGLADRKALRLILQQTPAQVVYVHGHIHRPWHWQPRNGRFKGLTFINAGAPCMATGAYPDGQGFWELQLSESDHQPVKAVHHLPKSRDRDHGPEAHAKRLHATGHGLLPDELTWEAHEYV